MRKIIILVATFLLLNMNKSSAQINIQYDKLEPLSNKVDSFIDTVQVIVLIHHLNDFEPSNDVSSSKAFMIRIGHLSEYNSAVGNTLAYHKSFMKIPDETKLYYINRENRQIPISKNNVLLIIEIK